MAYHILCFMLSNKIDYLIGDGDLGGETILILLSRSLLSSSDSSSEDDSLFSVRFIFSSLLLTTASGDLCQFENV